MKYSVKMRASKNINGDDVHISGAEKIVNLDDLYKTVENLQKRAINHEKGEPDSINIKIEKIKEEDILKLKALKVSMKDVESIEEGIEFLLDFLINKNIKNPEKIIELLKNTKNMRGAIILDLNSFKRLEKDPKRGVRVTYMDYENSKIEDSSSKNYFSEALALATKVVNAPGILAELCISDDPNYIIGYVASKEDGYIRISKLKEKGSDKGARIFLYNGDIDKLEETINYLEKKKVLIYE